MSSAMDDRSTLYQRLVIAIQRKRTTSRVRTIEARQAFESVLSLKREKRSPQLQAARDDIPSNYVARYEFVVPSFNWHMCRSKITYVIATKPFRKNTYAKCKQRLDLRKFEGSIYLRVRSAITARTKSNSFEREKESGQLKEESVVGIERLIIESGLIGIEVVMEYKTEQISRVLPWI